METTTNDTRAFVGVEIWLSYVGRGAPSNASPARIGLGATKEAAHAAAEHWNNQAPYARARKITLHDAAPYGADEREIAERMFGYLDLLEEMDAADRAAHAHFVAGRHASAWLALGGEVCARVYRAG